MPNVRFYVPVMIEVVVPDYVGDTEEQILAQAVSMAPNLYPVVQEMQITPKIKMWFASEYETAIVRMEEDDEGIDFEQRGRRWSRMEVGDGKSS